VLNILWFSFPFDKKIKRSSTFNLCFCYPKRIFKKLFEKAFIEEYGLLQIFDRDLLAPGQSFNVSDIPYIAFYVQELTDA